MKQNMRRRIQLLQTGLDELREKGWQATTMQAIALRANASKETLYKWFTDKTGFFVALIRANTADFDSVFLFQSDDLEERLRAVGRQYLAIMNAEDTMALRRAAIANAEAEPELGQVIIETSYDVLVPKLYEFFADAVADDALVIDDFDAAISAFFGLLEGEDMTKRLLGAPAWDDAFLDARSAHAAKQFVKLYQR